MRLRLNLRLPIRVPCTHEGHHRASKSICPTRMCDFVDAYDNLDTPFAYICKDCVEYFKLEQYIVTCTACNDRGWHYEGEEGYRPCPLCIEDPNGPPAEA